MAAFSDLIGKTLKACVSDHREHITFTTLDNEGYILHHHQDCCENVQIEDIVGDLSDLVGEPILKASEDSNFNSDADGYGSNEQWTFYNIATIKGSVTIRWYGSSNGYYSVGVSFDKQAGRAL